MDWRAKSIADNVVRFLFGEMISGRIPTEFLPLQAGVGNLANSVMAALGSNPYIPPFKMYSVTFQDSLVELMEKANCWEQAPAALRLRRIRSAISVRIWTFLLRELCCVRRKSRMMPE